MINRFGNLIYKLKNRKTTYIEINQDKFIAEYFDFFRNGIFIDIVGSDGSYKRDRVLR